jgi:hypothetical protein
MSGARTPLHGVCALLVGAACLAGCGARTGVDSFPTDDAGATTADASFDAGVDLAVDDASLRDASTRDDAAIETDAGCTSDEACDDTVACTTARCVSGRCVLTPDDAACDDGTFCTGTERCDAVRGCVTAPPSCADSIACTIDACDADADGCTNTPDDARCPISHRCDPRRGCIARVLAIDVSGGLYDVEVPSGDTRSFGRTDTELADIALAADGTFYGATFRAVVRVDATSGATTTLAAIETGRFNALDFAPDGTLYGAGSDRVVRVDPASGGVDPIATLPSGTISSGDLAFLPDGRMLLTGTRTGGTVTPDELYEIPLDGRAPRLVGTMGHACVWGLAAFGTTLYGLTCNGEVILVNPDTGTSRTLSRASARFGGAAAR